MINSPLNSFCCCTALKITKSRYAPILLVHFIGRSGFLQGKSMLPEARLQLEPLQGTEKIVIFYMGDNNSLVVKAP